MLRMPLRLLVLGCVTATLGGCLGFGTERPANVSGLCRSLGNELAAAAERSQVDEVFEAGVAAGCWARPKGRR